ncbi:MAG: hypothetical protein ACOYNR_16095, partial [Blastocatellia bacterium]
DLAQIWLGPSFLQPTSRIGRTLFIQFVTARSFVWVSHAAERALRFGFLMGRGQGEPDETIGKIRPTNER